MEKILAYHGTNKKAADSILKNGFNKGSWFAYHLEDALAFGGNYVFVVWFDKKKFNNTGKKDWQFWTQERISVESIKSLKRFDISIISLKKVKK